jgi:DNA-directed RNA polymerase subunit M/transcription elongation factor TFIIS
MLCPRCHSSMVAQKENGLLFWECTFCGETIEIENRRSFDGSLQIELPEYTPRIRWGILGKIIRLLRGKT